ncbi:unnamed protein product [Cochlearia groenlandica]
MFMTIQKIHGSIDHHHIESSDVTIKPLHSFLKRQGVFPDSNHIKYNNKPPCANKEKPNQRKIKMALYPRNLKHKSFGPKPVPVVYCPSKPRDDDVCYVEEARVDNPSFCIELGKRDRYKLLPILTRLASSFFFIPNSSRLLGFLPLRSSSIFDFIPVSSSLIHQQFRLDSLPLGPFLLSDRRRKDAFFVILEVCLSSLFSELEIKVFSCFDLALSFFIP